MDWKFEALALYPNAIVPVLEAVELGPIAVELVPEALA